MRVAPFALVVTAALAAAGCGSSSSGGTVAADNPVAPSVSSAAAGSPTGGGSGASKTATASAGGTLTIADFTFDPTPLTVSPGQVVSVTNTDSAEHTATSDMAGLFSGDDIKQGKTVTFKAPTSPGTYTFHCQYHASMHGTLIVK